MAAVEKKKEEKEVSYFSPGALRWMALNGVDYRALFSSAKKHEDSASQFEKVLRRKSLKVCENELNGYLKEFRAAETELRKLASFLSDPDFKSKFLDENKDYSEASYDAAVANVRKKASFCQNAAWAYEKVYAKKYGPRQEYSTHLLVRDVARQLREEMEKAAGSAPSPAYKRAPERAAFAQNARVEPVTRETHALVSRFMQDLQKKYGEEPSEKGETRVARSDNSGYHRGGRAGMAYINAAAARRDEEERGAYHRGERRILSEREQVMIARRDVPRKSEEELLAGEARISKVKEAPSSVAQAQANINRAKKQKLKLKKEIASLSGAKRKEAAEQLAELNKELFKLRRVRDSLV
jgi:hypothetical protein